MSLTNTLRVALATCLSFSILLTSTPLHAGFPGDFEKESRAPHSPSTPARAEPAENPAAEASDVMDEDYEDPSGTSEPTHSEHSGLPTDESAGDSEEDTFVAQDLKKLSLGSPSSRLPSLLPPPLFPQRSLLGAFGILGSAPVLFPELFPRAAQPRQHVQQQQPALPKRRRLHSVDSNEGTSEDEDNSTLRRRPNESPRALHQDAYGSDNDEELARPLTPEGAAQALPHTPPQVRRLPLPAQRHHLQGLQRNFANVGELAPPRLRANQDDDEELARPFTPEGAAQAWPHTPPQVRRMPLPAQRHFLPGVRRNLDGVRRNLANAFQRAGDETPPRPHTDQDAVAKQAKAAKKLFDSSGSDADPQSSDSDDDSDEE